jgi:hypothetical protein
MEHGHGESTGPKAEVQLKHVAAESTTDSTAMTPEEELKRLREIRTKHGGQKLFQKDAHGTHEEVPVVDFGEMARVRATITDHHHQDAFDRQVANIQNLASEEQPRAEAVEDARRGFGHIEVFSDAVAMGLNEPGVTADMVRNYLRGVPGALTGAPGAEAKINGVIKYHLAKPEYRHKLEEIVSRITLPADFETTKAQAEQLRELERQEVEKRARQATLQANITAVEDPTSRTYIPLHQRAELKRTYEAVDSLTEGVKRLGAFAGDPTPATLHVARGRLIAEVNRYQGAADAIKTRVPVERNRSEDEKREVREAEKQADAYRRFLGNVDSALALLNPADPAEAANLLAVRRAEAARADLEKVNQELIKIHQDKAPLRGAQHKMERDLVAYQHKLEKALGTAAQGYWNDVLLEKAQELANTEVRATEAIAKEAQTTQEAGDAVLASFLRESYLVRGGLMRRSTDVTGIDKKWLKQMSNDVKRSGPADMARSFLDHIDRAKTRMTPEQRAQVTRMMEKIKDPTTGVYKISPEGLQALGTKYMPQVLGESWAHGNKVKFSRAETEHVRNMYNADFWDAAMGSRTEFQKQADALFGKGVLNFGEEFKHDTAKLLGKVEFKKNWPKYLKLAALVGGVGVLAAGGGPAVATAAVGFGEAVVKGASHLVGEAGETLDTLRAQTEIKLEQPGGPLEPVPTGGTMIDPQTNQPVDIMEPKLQHEVGKAVVGAQGVLNEAGRVATNVAQEAAKAAAVATDGIVDAGGNIMKESGNTVGTFVSELQKARLKP